MKPTISRAMAVVTTTFGLPAAAKRRYLAHSRTCAFQARSRAALSARLAECGLQMHPEKTQIVYCRDGSRKEKYPNTKFDFLGYTFRPRVVKNPYGQKIETAGKTGSYPILA